MMYRVIWRSMPGKIEIRSESFTELDDARTEAKLFALGISGEVETSIYDPDGTRIDIAVTDNA